ncbi:MAG: hypothetical protein JO063_08595 [Pseudonocardiales bacterium]|nr:hypothetical protein [Pseudonocardiales bacterium]MBV9031872.1 hypothetical protein [Pseudonocardiales bacterium]MBW0010162.1 hypothetical protein [Pseudonocardiales bacterium]
MQHKGDRAGRDTDDQHHGNGRPAQLDIGRRIRPGTAAPSRMLVADAGDASLFLRGWRDGPSAYLGRAGAVPLRWELVAAFGSAALAVRGNQGEAS